MKRKHWWALGALAAAGVAIWLWDRRRATLELIPGEITVTRRS